MVRDMTRMGVTSRLAIRYGAVIALLAVGLLSILTAIGGSPTTPPTITLSLTPFATGLTSPVGVHHAGAGDDRLFVIELAGTIRIVQSDGTAVTTPFLDISGRVESGGERGLLGLAFHPTYPGTPYFYVNYSTKSTGATRISRFTVTADPNVADPNSETILFTVDQPFSNHNAGDIHFGPDGYLYIPLGDGGSGGDPGDRAQDMTLLLGKVARIDVDATPSGADCVGDGSGQYAVPASNPFRDGAGGACDEIWAVGLRNPYRSSFDRLTGDFYIADVGQGAREEIDFQPAASAGGENYGWRCYEGNLPFNTSGCPMSGFTFPVFDYDNPELGCAVIGGYVYRGTLFPALSGRYVFTDLCSGNFWDMIRDSTGTWRAALHTNLAQFGYVSFGEDTNGEIYVVHQGNGTVSRLEGIFRGDLNGDDVVDRADQRILHSSLGRCTGEEGFIRETDYNGSGCTDLDDYRLWVGFYRDFVPPQPCNDCNANSRSLFR
jgi:glucose/arabinose dehydrogenase